MHRRIRRRDVLHGMALASVCALSGRMLGGCSSLAGPVGSGQDAPGYYPPELTGLRGSAPGSFETAHAVRDGRSWNEARDLGEQYDLVVVGAGISGLAAAHFFRAKAGPDSRILVLDNHDDFGGHARRNEFHQDGQLHLLNGGTLMIDSPRPYSAVADGLLRALGVDVEALIRSTQHPQLYESMGLHPGVFFDRETFGSDQLITGRAGTSWVHWLDQAPLSQTARAQILQIEEGRVVDPMPGLSSAEKKLRLSAISFRDFLRDYVKVEPAVLAFYQARTHDEWGVGIDAVSALDCWGFGIKGFQGMNLEPGEISRMGFTAAGYASTGGSYQLSFPDGNATIARLLVRSLIPGACAGGSVEDLMTARFDYGRLDQYSSPVRLRLNSTAVRARHLGAPSTASEVEVTYVRDARAYRVGAAHCVLACYNMMIPYLCPELPPTQKDALHSLVKTPLVYTSVALRSGRALQALGISEVYAPGCYHSNIFLSPPVTIGAYRSPTSADQPTLIRMLRTPCQPGLTEQQQNRAGRAELLATSFETFERNIRDQLRRTLGPGGLDPATDITAITVNRWPHGYAYEYNSLFDDFWLNGGETPCQVARKPFGRIAIANSDADAYAYTDCAIDQGYRAVQELKK